MRKVEQKLLNFVWTDDFNEIKWRKVKSGWNQKVSGGDGRI